MKRLLLPIVFTVAFQAPAKAEIIYDNSSNFEGLYNNTRNEAGDQVVLGGSARLLTEFAFEYFAGFTATGDETARIRFYYNDGPAQEGMAAPGTLFYDSGAFSIASGYRTVRGDQLEILLEADTFTFTFEFSGLGANETAGLLYYNPPTIGSSGPSFWQKEGGIWQAVAVSETGNNLAARFVAEQALEIATVSRQNPGMAITANVRPGRSYGLEYTTALGSNAWKASGSNVQATTNRLTFTDVPAGSDQVRIYRVVDRTAP